MPIAVRYVDDLVIGAGPAATGVVAALQDAALRGVRRSRLIVGGDASASPEIALSRFGAPDLSASWSEAVFGLPAVRAFGEGGSTNLWHGGLFVPHADDEVRGLSGLQIDLTSQLAEFAESRSARCLPIAPAIRFIQRDPSLRTSGAWRTLIVPRAKPALLSPLRLGLGRSENYDVRTALRFERKCDGLWRTWILGPSGVEPIESERLFLAAGCIASSELIMRSFDLSSINFTDHLHVFAGVLYRKALPPELKERLEPRKTALKGYTRRYVWKERVAAAGIDADVGLSFRSVANPEFPRAGRRMARFIGYRTSGLSGKLALGIKHPLTALEMLLYKWGIEVPFESYLVHATISPRGHIGTLAEECPRFTPNSRAIAEVAREAFSRFTVQFGIDRPNGSMPFDQVSIGQSIISGAQFAAGPRALPAASDEGLFLADTASMEFTSIYNQCLMSLLIGYRCAAQAVAIPASEGAHA